MTLVLHQEVSHCREACYIRPERWLFCNNTDLDLVAKGFCASYWPLAGFSCIIVTDLLLVLNLGGLFGTSLLLRLALLEKGLRDEDLVLGGNAMYKSYIST